MTTNKHLVKHQALNAERRSELFHSAGETIDRMMSMEVRAGGFMNGVVPKLYAAARQLSELPLAMSAAEQLLAALEHSRSTVIITGHLYPDLMPNGETDGPPGAAALAAILDRALGIHPIVMCDEPVFDPMAASLLAAGLRYRTDAPSSVAHPHEATLLTIPVEPEEARQLGDGALADADVGALVSIEKISRNSRGRLHSGLGSDLSGVLGRADMLFDWASDNDVFTVGVGDLGNELGFGKIEHAVRQHVPYADMCRCPCRGGVAASVAADALLVAGTSNWGAYALEASIAALLGRPELIHSGATETRVLEAATAAGAVDGLGMTTVPGADGMPAEFHATWVELLRRSVEISCGEAMSSRVVQEVGSSIPYVDQYQS